MAELLRRREIAAVEVVETHLERIAAVNPALNAVVQSTAGAARAEPAAPTWPLSVMSGLARSTVSLSPSRIGSKPRA